MGYNVRMETYLNRELAAKVDDIEQPNSAFIRESVRRELQRRQIDENESADEENNES